MSTTTANDRKESRQLSSTNVDRLMSLPEGAYEVTADARKISSVVLQEEYLEPLPEPTVRYVDVPKIEEVIKYVVKKEVREIERVKPKYIDTYVDKFVDVPKYVDTIKYVEEIVPVEVIKKVPKVVKEYIPKAVVQNQRVEKKKAQMEVQEIHDLIEVPKVVTVTKKLPVTDYKTVEQSLIVAQTVKPIIIEGSGEVHVDVTTYEPEVIPVDIHVAKFVDTKLVQVGTPETSHKVVSVPPPQYNSMLKYLNQHLSETEQECLPYIADENNEITFMTKPLNWKAPSDGTKTQSLPKGQNVWSSGTQINSTVTRLDGRDAVVAANQEAQKKLDDQIEHYKQKKEQTEANMKQYNAAELERAQNAVKTLNAQWDTEFEQELENIRNMNEDRRVAASQGL